MSHKILVIDIGNTKSKIAVAQDGKLCSEVILSDHETTVRDALKISQQHKTAGCLVSSVAEGAVKMIKRMRASGMWVKLLTADMTLPFTIDYATPTTLGTDRIAATAGVVANFGLVDTLIIDAGTAITYDYLTADGHFLGGCISPGVSMRFRALHAFTAKLPLTDPTDDTGGFYGTDTRSAIAIGIMVGLRAETNAHISNFRKQKPNSIVVITGGNNKYFELTTEMSIFVRPNLVLEGLADIANANINQLIRPIQS